MAEQAFFTVGEAAKQVRRSKATISNAITTISNAIKSGRLSVHEKSESGYKIAASELFRVFPTDERSPEQTRTPANDTVNTAALIEIEGLRRENVLLRDERDDLRRRLDSESEERRKLTALLTDHRQQQQPEPMPLPRKGFRAFLHRLTG
jgi:hypothetical protein